MLYASIYFRNDIGGRTNLQGIDGIDPVPLEFHLLRYLSCHRLLRKYPPVPLLPVRAFYCAAALSHEADVPLSGQTRPKI